PTPPRTTPFPYTTLFRSSRRCCTRKPSRRRFGKSALTGHFSSARRTGRLRWRVCRREVDKHATHNEQSALGQPPVRVRDRVAERDRKSTRLNSSHQIISY